MADQVVITDGFIREWNRIRAKVDSIGGAGVTNTMTSISIAPPPPVASPTDPADDSRRWAKISSTCTKSGTYNLKSATRNATDFDETVSGALSLSTYYDFNSTEDFIGVNFFETGTGSHLLPVDCVVFGWRKGVTKGGKPIIELDRFFAGVFAVNLSSPVGSSPSFTYTIKTIDNAVTLGSGIGVSGMKLPGNLTAGTTGIAYYNASGSLVLYSANETSATSACTAP